MTMTTLTFKDVIDYKINVNNEHINYGGGELLLTIEGGAQTKILLEPKLPSEPEEN